MLLAADTHAPAHRILGYADGRLRLRDRELDASCLVTAAEILPWPVAEVAALTVEDFAPLWPRGIEVVLLATGARQQWPPPELLAALAARRVGLEVMDTGAASRTFNLLAGDGRPVALAAVLGRHASAR
ncbi:MAG: Mth938-like domain-containing protein [Proteobacteria bacterium]|nr:Mth938-like domain-containing protein [Pseudomonadota bacterium]